MDDNENHPCKGCADYIPPSKHHQTYPFVICVNQQRLEGTENTWTTCNRRGPKCYAYVAGDQKRLEEF